MRDFLRGFLVGGIPAFGFAAALWPAPREEAPEAEAAWGDVCAVAVAPAPVSPSEPVVPGLRAAPADARSPAPADPEALRLQVEDIERADLPVSVRVVDAVDGTAVAGARWSMEQRDGDGPEVLAGPSSIERVRKATANWHTLRAHAPPRYVAWDEPEPTEPSIYARSAVTLVPLRRETVFEVEFVDERGRPVEGVAVESVSAAGHALGPPPEVLGAGRLRIFGLPFLPGEPVAVTIAHDRFRVVADTFPSPWTGVVPADAADVLFARIVVEPIGGWGLGRGFSREGRAGHRNLRAGGGAARAPETGTLHLTVSRHDGRRASFATVSVLRHVDATLSWCRHLRLDRDGVVEEELPEGSYRLRLDQAGLVTTIEDVEITVGRARRVSLREAAGGTVRVTVVNEAGRRLPFARLRTVQKEGFSWIDLDPETGVQRLDAFVDERGERTLRRVTAGHADIAAEWGTRHGAAGADVRDDGEESVTVVLK